MVVLRNKGTIEGAVSVTRAVQKREWLAAWQQILL